MENTAVVIGRFQPFHMGHAWLIKKAISKYKKAIILIGSPDKDDNLNPWSYELRLNMIKKFLKKEKIEDKILKIDSIKDVPDDNDWLNLAIEKIAIKKFVVVGDNDWVNNIFENEGYKTYKPGYFKREKYEGTRIRELFKNDHDWQSYVPKYLIKLISK